MATITINSRANSVSITKGSSEVFYKLDGMSMASSGNLIQIRGSDGVIYDMTYGTDTITVNGDSTFADVAELKEAINAAINFDDTSLGLAIAEIGGTYGDVVSVVEKKKSLLKYGENTDLDTTEETVWLRGGIETYATGNDIDSISSSNAGDTQTVTIEGHTMSGGELTFVTQNATLTGQTPVTLTTPLFRSTRIFNTGSTDFAGTIYIFESGGTVTAGVPQTEADIHLQAGDDNQSLKCATSLSNQDYWIITSMACSVNRQNSRAVDFRLKVREYGKVYRTKYTLAVHSNGGTAEVVFNPPLIVPPNSDMRVDATSSGASTVVSAAVNGYLAIKV